MIEFPDYRRATNAAYDVLQYYDGTFPEIKILTIIKRYPNIKICSYSCAAQKLNVSHSEFTYQYASSEQGFTVADRPNNRYIIYYNDFKDTTTTKFTLAHELGHIILGHTNDNEIADKEANCFARNLLCPIQIIIGFQLETVSDYTNCFHISEPMAVASICNKKSDEYYITKQNYDSIDEKVYCYMVGCTPAELYGYA